VKTEAQTGMTFGMKVNGDYTENMSACQYIVRLKFEWGCPRQASMFGAAFSLIENVENIIQERFLTPSLIVGYAAVTIPVVSRLIVIIQLIVLALFRIRVVLWISRGYCGAAAVRPLDDFVQFTPVEPDPAALRTIVDLDILAFRNLQIYSFTYRAEHKISFLTTSSVNRNFSDVKTRKPPLNLRGSLDLSSQKSC
jgi:hypothetical protein